MSQPKEFSWCTSAIANNKKNRKLRNRIFPRYFAEEWHLSVSPYMNNVSHDIVSSTAHLPSSNTITTAGTYAGTSAGTTSEVVTVESSNFIMSGATTISIFNIVTPDSVCESSSQCLSSNNEAVINFSSTTMPKNQLDETRRFKYTPYHEETYDDDAKQSFKKQRAFIRSRLSWLFLFIKRRRLKENITLDNEEDKMISTSQHSGNEKRRVDWKDRLFLLKKSPFSSSSDVTYTSHASESSNGITSSYSSDFVKSKCSFTMKSSDFDYRVMTQQKSSSLSQSLNNPLPVVMEELI